VIGIAINAPTASCLTSQIPGERSQEQARYWRVAGHAEGQPDCGGKQISPTGSAFLKESFQIRTPYAASYSD